jgi:hypothetical protein
MDSFYRISPGFGAKVGNLQESGYIQLPHPTLSKGEGFKILFFKVSPFGGDLEGASPMTRY